MFIEKQDYDEGHYGDAKYLRWNYVAGQDVTYGNRNYTVFGVLAGVRDQNVTPISKPRGLPPDVDPTLRNELDVSDYHSLSYLSLKEIRDYKWDRETCGDFVEWFEALRVTHLNYYPDHVRFVFGFDS
jgi:hypothetical protein